jgi:hypothetical protein
MVNKCEIANNTQISQEIPEVEGNIATTPKQNKIKIRDNT